MCESARKTIYIAFDFDRELFTIMSLLKEVPL